MVDVPSKGYQPIENYGIIGDLYTVARWGWMAPSTLWPFPTSTRPPSLPPCSTGKRAGGFRLRHGC